jgi:hypothetical protein
MRSVSSLAIDWLQPELLLEQWEFFHHPAKQPFYREHGITWESIEMAFPAGRLVPYPREAHICGVPVAHSHHTFDDYSRFLAKAKRGYRLNYNRMEDALQRDGSLALPAAIVLRAGSAALLFSGYRRLCLAWNYGMTPYIWLVPLTDV